MKKLIIACAILACSSIVSFAQSAIPTSAQAEKTAELRAKSYQKQLGLTRQQYDVIYKAELSYAHQEEVAKANGGPGTGQAYQMQLGRDNQYKSVLTAEQYAKYDASRPKPTVPGAPASMAH